MTDHNGYPDTYRPHSFEAKWQREWERQALYRADNESERPKFYLLEFFPYPSGDGLSVGHSKNYVPMDTLARFKRMNGFNVLHPMGWDAFGLPAENEAIIRQVHPQDSTAKNAANYKRQMNLQGLSYDWTREIDASQPEYYRWTQWLFLQMYKRGLAYRQMNPQWWCPKCQTILANEQVENGFCWRHGDQLVERKKLEQWYFRITDYAEELLATLDGLDWPEPILAMQRNWIGRSTGALIEFQAEAANGDTVTIPVFTTRPDTVFGATFLVLSPEHPELDRLTAVDCQGPVDQYRRDATRESEIVRLSTDRKKTGLAIGSFATNPFTGERIPIWISDYVLVSYGTGAIMAVPGHDERDAGFAAQFGLPSRTVVDEQRHDGETAASAHATQGVLVNSGAFTGLSAPEGRRQIIAALETRSIGKATINYRMRDWLVSRQRYWGAPIPMVYCDGCGIVPVPEDQLPVTLPRLERYQPAGDGRSPLATVPEFVNTTCPSCGGTAQRETDTLDTFVDSSWYYLRYCSPHDSRHAWTQGPVDYWCPIDLYVGGAEHAVMHLLYFRFVTKVLNDAGLVNFREPALQLRNQGQMHAADGFRMSKSRRNVVTPDSVVERFSADSLRAYLMFMGPFDGDATWDDQGINGVWRWLNRVWELGVPSTNRADNDGSGEVDSTETIRAMHRTIAKVTNDVENLRFNTAVSTLMEFTNHLQKTKTSSAVGVEFDRAIETLLILMAPLTPFISEELWHKRGHRESIHLQAWPSFEPALAEQPTVNIVIQVNGRHRDTLVMPKGSSKEQVESAARAKDLIVRWLEDKTVKSLVFVPDRLMNFVI
jgi:leucyl-tRNA synthetase